MFRELPLCLSHYILTTTSQKSSPDSHFIDEATGTHSILWCRLPLSVPTSLLPRRHLETTCNQAGASVAVSSCAKTFPRKWQLGISFHNKSLLLALKPRHSREQTQTAKGECSGETSHGYRQCCGGLGGSGNWVLRLLSLAEPYCGQVQPSHSCRRSYP